MRIIIRTDANRNIGMGHIMRCLSISDFFSSAGHYVSFVLADETVINLIKCRGYDGIILHSDYTNMDGEPSDWICDVGADLIIVDSYFVTESYFRQLRNKMKSTSGKLVYIDDICSFPYSVDILVNYNAYAESDTYAKLYRGLKEPNFILGPRYAPLRSMFKEIEKKVQPKRVENILISTGGADELHLSLAIVRYLVEQGNADKTYHILLGAMNTDKKEIELLAGDSIVLHENIIDMKSLIANCDLAISAAGSTLYEICACGVPLITFSVADNQILGADAFERIGLGENIGDLRDPDSINPKQDMSGSLEKSAVNRIMYAAQELSSNYEKRVKMGVKMQTMVDGFGADRIGIRIMELLYHTHI